MRTSYIYFVIAYYEIYCVNSAENGCEFGDSCFWNIQNGFQVRTYEKLKDDICKEATSCVNVNNITGDVLFLGKGTTGTIYSIWFDAKQNGKENCVSVLTYQSNVTSSFTFKVEKGKVEHVIDTMNASDTYRWNLLKIQYKEPEEKYRISIEVNPIEATGFLIISNINLTSDCQLEKDGICADSDTFACDDISCVPVTTVCDLKKDCKNGRDELFCDDLSVPATCTLENGTCGWRSVEHKKGFNWILQRGPTPTQGTGPAFDHTTGTSEGYYYYVDGSHGDLIDTAYLQSLIMPPVEEAFRSKCKLRFFYHMIGKDIGALSVGLRGVCSQNTIAETLWTKHGDQGDKWNFAEIDLINTSSRYNIQFDGSGAFLSHGDIAIDDISFSPECFGITREHNGFSSVSSDHRAISVQEFKNNTELYCSVFKRTDSKVVSNRSSDSEGHQTESSSVTSEVAIYGLNEHPEKMSVVNIIAITLAGVAVAIVMGTALLCLAIRRRKDNTPHSAQLEMVSTAPDYHSNTIPVQSSSIDMQLRCAVTELNPNYEFITAIFPGQQLREIPRNKLNLIRLLGQGAFGEVYEGRLKNMCANVSELPVAVKTLPAVSTPQAENDFLMEAVIISKFMHKNVVKCLGVCFDEHPRYIVLELLEGGDLRSFLRDSRTKVEHKCTLIMEDLIKLAIDISNGCRHLEEKHFVHRDIAARNCLLTTRGPGRIAKIADFGMSRDIYSSDYYKKDGKAMLPIKWMPPEAFLDGVFTSKTDTWSYGVLLWEIFTLAYMPYPGQTNNDVMHFVASGGRLEPPEKCPARLSKIMIMCWNSVADIRPSFSEIAELLDMCIQDNEVLNTDVSLCHYNITECFKDASTLAKATSGPEDKTDEILSESETEGASGTAAEFRGHRESQSREPLLLSSSDS